MNTLSKFALVGSLSLVSACKHHEPHQVVDSLVAADGSAVVVIDSTSVYELVRLAPDGTRLWTRPLHGCQIMYAYNDMLASNADVTVVQCTNNDRATRIVAVSTADGTERWSDELKGKFDDSSSGGVVLVDDAVVSYGERTVRVFDRATGELRLKYPEKMYSPQHAVVNGHVLFAADGIVDVDVHTGERRPFEDIDRYGCILDDGYYVRSKEGLVRYSLSNLALAPKLVVAKLPTHAEELRGCGTYKADTVFEFDGFGMEDQEAVVLRVDSSGLIVGETPIPQLHLDERFTQYSRPEASWLNGRLPRFSSIRVFDREMSYRVLTLDLETSTIVASRESPEGEVVFRDGTNWVTQSARAMSLLDGNTNAVLASASLDSSQALTLLGSRTTGGGRTFLFGGYPASEVLNYVVLDSGLNPIASAGFTVKTRGSDATAARTGR